MSRLYLDLEIVQNLLFSLLNALLLAGIWCANCSKLQWHYWFDWMQQKIKQSIYTLSITAKPYKVRRSYISCSQSLFSLLFRHVFVCMRNFTLVSTNQQSVQCSPSLIFHNMLHCEYHFIYGHFISLHTELHVCDRSRYITYINCHWLRENSRLQFQKLFSEFASKTKTNSKNKGLSQWMGENESRWAKKKGNQIYRIKRKAQRRSLPCWLFDRVYCRWSYCLYLKFYNDAPIIPMEMLMCLYKL